MRKTAGVSVTFILVNSIVGLLGHWASVKSIPPQILWWAPAALVGGLIGSELGSRRLTPLTMRRSLATVLVVAGIKLLLPHWAVEKWLSLFRTAAAEPFNQRNLFAANGDAG